MGGTEEVVGGGWRCGGMDRRISGRDRGSDGRDILISKRYI